MPMSKMISVASGFQYSVNIGYEKNYPIDMEKNMFDSIKRGDVEDSVIYAGNYYEWLLNESEGDENDIRLKVIEFILWAERIAYEETRINYVFKSRSGYMNSLFNSDLRNGLKEWFTDKIKQAAANVAYKKNDRSSSTIQKAIVYINQNYTSDISLDEVSREVDVTPYYFSRLFKEELGVNFVEYVTNLRVERAKYLLKTEGKSIKEVCADVGYSDPNYFSRMFKKHEGLSPTEYKERML